MKREQNRHTRKKYPNYKKIFGNIISKKEGWIVIHIYGEPYHRGFAHGVLLYEEMNKIMKSFPFIVEKELKQNFSNYMKKTNEIIKPHIVNEFPEYFEEIKGMSDGFISKGIDVTVDYLIAWNSLLSMYSFYRNNKVYKCSAFIATGSVTEDGKIIMAHNTHADFVTGQAQNIIQYITPTNGHSFVMQTSPGYISSGTDWFISSNGIIGCETTISSIKYKPKFGSPYFCRIRDAMQYGKSLDEYTQLMLKNNAGDYACSWLFGNIYTNEIMLFEIGLNIHSIQRTFDGVYYGMNSAIDLKLRTIETNDKDLYNIEKSSGARSSRLSYLLNTVYHGKLNINNAKKILSDHYDIFLNKDEMNSRSICKHSELDVGKFTGKSNYPFGCTDGKVTNSTMASKMKFIGRFGSCCGRIFNANKHINRYPKYKEWKGILQDLPKKKWTLIEENN